MSDFSRATGAVALPKPLSTPSPTLPDFASSLGNIGGAVGETQVVSKGSNLQSWFGQAASAYSAESVGIQQKAIELQAVLVACEGQISSYGEVFQPLLDTTIPDYQQQWDAALRTRDENVANTRAELNSARAEAFDGEEFDDSTFVAEMRRQDTALADTQDELAKLYNTAVCAVDDAANSASIAMAANIDSLVTRGQDGAVPSRSDVGVFLFGDNGGLLAAQTLMAQATEDASDAASILSETDENGFPTEEALTEFNEKYGAKLESNPFFATAFFQEYPLEDLNALLASVPLDHLYDYNDEIAETVGYLGAGLILATGGTDSGDDAASSDVWRAWNHTGQGSALDLGGHKGLDDWRSNFQNEMIEAGRSSYSPHENSVHGIPGYSLMGQAMRLAGDNNPNLALGDSYLNGKNSVAHDMVAWSVENPQIWEEFAGGGLPLFEGAPLDPVQNMLTLIDGAEQPGKTWLNSKTTFAFDSDGNPETADATGNMTRYLVGHRELDFDGRNWQDQGEALGELLSEATGSDPTSRDSKEIAYNFITGYTDGLAEDRDQWAFDFGANQDLVDGQDVFGHSNSGLRGWAGLILDDHMSDIAESLRLPAPDSGVFDAAGRSTLNLDQDLVNKLIGAGGTGTEGFFADLAFHQPELVDENNIHAGYEGGRAPAINTLTDRAIIEMSAALDEVVGADGTALQMKDVEQIWGTTLESLTAAGPDATEQQDDALDASNARVQGLIKKGIGMIPFSEFLTTGQRYVQGQTNNLGLIDVGLEAVLNTNNAADSLDDAARAHNSVEVLVRDLVYSSVSAVDSSEFEGTDFNPLVDFSRGGEFYVPEMFDPETGELRHYSDMTPTQRAAFADWVSDVDSGAGAKYRDLILDIRGNLNDAQMERHE